MPLVRPVELEGQVDDAEWGKPFDPTDEDNSEEAAEARLLYCLHSYVYDGFYDEELFEAVVEDFRDWSEETFKLVSTDANRRFRNHLRNHGIFIAKGKGPIPWALAEIVNTETMPEWPEADLIKERKRKIMNSCLDPRSVKHPDNTAKLPEPAPKQAPPKPEEEITAQHVQHQLDEQLHAQQQQQRPKHTRNPSSMRDPNDRSYWINNAPTQPRQTSFVTPHGPQPSGTSPYETRFPIRPRPSTEDIHNPYAEVQEYPVQEFHPTRELANIGKCYTSNASIQFGGGTYDFLDAKLPIFIDNCIRCGLAERHWHLAFSFMLKDKARDYYYEQLWNGGLSYSQLVTRMKGRFHSLENRQMYLREWQNVSLPNAIRNNPDKSKMQCLEMVISKLSLIQKGLPVEQRSETALRDQLLSACQGVKECEMAIFKPALTYEKLCDDLKSAIGTAQRMIRTSSQYMEEPEEPSEQYWTDRTYGRNKVKYQNRKPMRTRRPRFGGKPERDRSKRCFICKKTGCWSTKHTLEERKKEYDNFRKRSDNKSKSYYQQFLYEYEGAQVDEYDDDVSDQPQDMEALITEYDNIGSESDPLDETEQFFSSHLGHTVNGPNMIAVLTDNVTVHQFTKADLNATDTPSSVFTSNLHRYSSDVFHGILPDSGAANVSTAGHHQFQALRKLNGAKLNTESAAMHKIRFGKGSATTLGTTQVRTPIGTITFHVVPAFTPFLLSLRDMDRLGVKLDNLTNELIQGNKRIPIIRKWGHPWLLLHTHEETAACHLTEVELRRLHRRFGHPSVQKLTNLLKCANPQDQLGTQEAQAIQQITQRCHACQMKAPAPGRFRFRLKNSDEQIFNFEIIIDIFHLESRPILHIIDEATSFQAARFLKDQSTKTVWNTIKECWIDTYLGPPEAIRHDAGTNFASAEFKSNAYAMAIEIREVPVEAHQSIGKVERYHSPLRRAYEIIRSETSGMMTADQALQAAVKAVNDTAGPNGLVPTLLVFGAYPRVTQASPPSATTFERAEAIRNAMREIRKINAQIQVATAMKMRNGPDTTPTKLLPLRSYVKVWREANGWTGPYRLLDMNDESCTIEMPRGPAQFRSTVVKPYRTETEMHPDKTPPGQDPDELDPDASNDQEPSNLGRKTTRQSQREHEANTKQPDTQPTWQETEPKDIQTQDTNIRMTLDHVRIGPGQESDAAEMQDNTLDASQEHSPKITQVNDDTEDIRLGSEKDKEQTNIIPFKRGRGRPRKDGTSPGNLPRTQQGPDSDQPRIDIQNAKRGRGRPRKNTTFITAKEQQSHETSKTLRKSGVIATPGKPFEQSDKAEIDALIKSGVFKFEKFNAKAHGNHRIFKSRMVQEVKGIGTDSPYEKSRLVVQGYADAGKEQILTQSPTLQRASQRLILAIAPALKKEFKLEVWTRDVKQAYTQSKTDLQRPILARIPEQIRHLHPENTILRIIKPLYGIAEAGTHWWATYSKHHQEKLNMVTSTYDPCLLLSRDPTRTTFGIVGMQTDDTLILCNPNFAQMEETKLQEAKLIAKPKDKLTSEKDLMFNGCRIKLAGENIQVLQKGQSQKLAPVNTSENDPKQQYIEQRARGAYIATICQPEASFDLSVAAQHQDPGESEINDLNKRLKWQMENQERGLSFVPFDIRKASLFVFVDSSFANNKDMSSQLGFVIVLGTETRTPEGFRIRGNIVHYSSTKSKRVTRSVLASEIYGMVSGADMAYALNTTLQMITEEMQLPKIETIICTDSYSLYECLVKLGTTKEKRLMIDIMSLRQSYERRELYEIRWIDGADNPADAFTKRSPNKTLKTLIESNTAQIRIDGWVDRKNCIHPQNYGEPQTTRDRNLSE